MGIEASLDKKNLLIVGGTGFLGTHVAKEAVLQGFRVLILSKYGRSYSRQIAGIEYLTVDVSNKKKLSQILKGRIFEYVINLGGYIDHANYARDGDKVIDVHFNGIKNLIDCLNKNSLVTFIQVGSSDEYGSNSSPQNESQREVPISPYSFAKTAATHFLQMLYRTENFPVIILRPFLVYGPGQGGDRLIPQIIKGCVENQEFPVSKGDQIRDFCYVNDFVNAIFVSIGNKNTYGEVVNIASGAPITIKEVIAMIQGIVGSGFPQFGLIPYRTGENMSLYADINKAKVLLKWRPTTSIEEGLAITIDFYNEK